MNSGSPVRSTLLQQASENSDLAEGGLKGAVVGEPRLK